MPSYDKNKLLSMLEARRAARLALSDQNERLRDAKREREAAQSAMRRGGGERRHSHTFLDDLLALPLEKAAGLTCDEVQGYERQVGNALERYSSGVTFQTWCVYLDARRKVERLQQRIALDRADFEGRFAIVNRLLDAVRGWGFRDPELEL